MPLKSWVFGFVNRRVALQQLPPELALSLSIDQRKEAAEASRKGESILALEPDVEWRKKNEQTATLLLPGYWTEDLQVHAQGDFLDNGGEQVVVGVDTQVIGGSGGTQRVSAAARVPCCPSAAAAVDENFG